MIFGNIERHILCIYFMNIGKLKVAFIDSLFFILSIGEIRDVANVG